MRRVMTVLSLLALVLPIVADGARGMAGVELPPVSRQGGPDEATADLGPREILARATGDQDEVKMQSTSRQGPDEATLVSGLREALAVASGEALTQVSRVDGFFANDAIKIPVPERMQKVAETLNMLGFQKEVEAFVLSMNRAAEHAAPNAAPYFFETVKGLTFDDARSILKGTDTAATEYFKAKTYGKLYEAFKPEVSASMNEAGVARSYKVMMEKYQSLPFMKVESVDLDQYVTKKSLDGIFTMVGQAETQIRTNPEAQVTPLLKKVFGKRGP
ncbi:MAG TPA: DUF4197 domain-containing protein [Syntrophobacteria bacterium]|nr:DUF4197 domain-containing protein [Syntrophobacteria bacterium]